MKISLILPTRGRPQNILSVYRSCLQTANRPDNIEFCFYIDDDDAPSVEALESLGDPARVKWVQGPRIVLSEMWNKAYQEASGEILMHAGDDIVFRTPGWDRHISRVFERFPDRIVFVHGRDGFLDAELGTHGFVHRNWVETVGYLVPPYFSSDYNDVWLDEVAGLIKRRIFVPEVLTEHMHPACGKGPLDRTHQDRLERHSRDDVDALYTALAAERARDAGKLRSFIEANRPTSSLKRIREWLRECRWSVNEYRIRRTGKVGAALRLGHGAVRRSSRLWNRRERDGARSGHEPDLPSSRGTGA